MPKSQPAADKETLQRLTTEGVNAASRELDAKSALEIAQIINSEDQNVALAVSKALPQIARAIDGIADRINRGGRLIYIGAGTSGRIAALDASECPPTFSVDAKVVQYVMAGGEKALARAAEANEDSRELGISDLKKRKPSKKDVVCGIAASGRTPYTVAAVEYARKKGTLTIGVSCNPDSPLARAAEIPITVEVGAEVISGSTRMKAGTAQKLVLNMLTTGTFTRLGYVYGNLMVNVSPKNEKLIERAITILSKAADIDRATAADYLEKSGRSVPTALVMLKAGVKKAEAAKRLKRAKGNVRQAISG